jgi:hypothetical protein
LLHVRPRYGDERVSGFYYDERGHLRNGTPPPASHPWRDNGKQKKLRAARARAALRAHRESIAEARRMYGVDDA